MYKKISFYIQIAILLVLVKTTLQAQAFNFVYIDTCYTEPYNKGYGTMLSWISKENDLLEYYVIERSADQINWHKVNTMPKSKVINMTEDKILYRWMDNVASHKIETTYWYRIRAVSVIGEVIYDAPPIPNKAVNHSTVCPFVFESRVIKISFFNSFFAKGGKFYLVNMLNNKTYTFEEPLEKGMQKITIPKEWNLTKGSYILRIGYELPEGITYSNHIIYLL